MDKDDTDVDDDDTDDDTDVDEDDKDYDIDKSDLVPGRACLLCHHSPLQTKPH